MTYAGLRLFEVFTVIGFIVLQIVLIQKQNYTAAMIASVVYIPGAYFLKHFLYGSIAAVGVIKANQYMNTLTNDRELRGSPIRAAPTSRSALRTPGTSQIQTGLSDGPVIFSRPPITITSSTLSPSQVVEVSTYDHTLPEITTDTKERRKQQSDDAEVRRKQEMAEMTDRLAQKFINFNTKFSTFKSQFSQNA